MSHPDSPSAAVIVESNIEPSVGEFIGQCKWFSDMLGYGFLTIQSGSYKGKDIFVHHTAIKPLNSNYRTLKTGEYVNLDIATNDATSKIQATNVTGIGGGSLICDFVSTSRPIPAIFKPIDNVEKRTPFKPFKPFPRQYGHFPPLASYAASSFINGNKKMM